MSAIAEAIGFQFYPGSDPKQQFLSYLREKSMLLVLDNMEHLLEDITLVSDILAAAPDVRIIATSRERLNLREEWVLEVNGMSYPANETEADIGHYSAIELFLQHARRVSVGFTLDNAHKPAVIRVCRLVGGMPLGIELAAVWVRALSCEAIADEISRSLDVLETPARNVEPRHRNMRGAFEPTWQKLTEVERDTFKRLSVFRGGFQREAAEQVAGASLFTLSSLVDKSLLRMDATGRYDLHELLRQYAADKLDEAGDSSATADRHLDYCLKLVDQVEAHQWGREQVPWFDRVEVELDNLRAALAWSLRGGAADKGLQLAAALGWFFTERAHWSEGLAWMERTLAVSQNATVFLRAKALQTAGRIVNSLPRTPVFCEQALSLARAANDRWNIAWALSNLGIVKIIQDSEQAAATLDESLRLFRELEDAMGLSHTLIRRSWVAKRQRDYPYMRALAEEALIAAREVDDLIITGWALFNLGQVSQFQDHDLKQAETHYESSISLFRAARFWGVFTVGIRLAQIEQALGNDARSQTLFKEALVHWGEQDPHDASNDVAFVGLAHIARAQGQLERAAHLLAAVNRDTLLEHYTKFSNVFSEQNDFFESDVASVRAQLGEDAFAQAWAAGKAMTRQQAIAYALEDGTTLIEMKPTEQLDDSETEQSRQPASQTLIEPLSERELEILRLIADGLNSREVAQRLVLSVGTIRWYLKQIYNKLDAHSRSQAIARARELELLG